MAKLFALLLWVKSIAVGDIKMKTSSKYWSAGYVRPRQAPDRPRQAPARGKPRQAVQARASRGKPRQAVASRGKPRQATASRGRSRPAPAGYDGLRCRGW